MAGMDVSPADDVAEGLLRGYSVPAGMLPPGRAGEAFSRARAEAARDPGALALWIPRVSRAVADAPSLPEVDGMTRVHLSWLALEAGTRRGSFPDDKVCRWLGFCEGAVASGGAGGSGLSDAAALCDPGAARSSGSRALHRSLGFLQACLCAAGVGGITVLSERERTRPLFHRAYSLDGKAAPETISRIPDGGETA